MMKQRKGLTTQIIRAKENLKLTTVGPARPDDKLTWVNVFRIIPEFRNLGLTF